MMRMLTVLGEIPKACCFGDRPCNPSYVYSSEQSEWVENLKNNLT